MRLEEQIKEMEIQAKNYREKKEKAREKMKAAENAEKEIRRQIELLTKEMIIEEHEENEKSAKALGCKNAAELFWMMEENETLKELVMAEIIKKKIPEAEKEEDRYDEENKC
ncbi:MAG: hypothetical protein J6J86_08670 [Lachnospiraceae bacterium]|nr:hypothetical protein [Lachnospiraceae bacterium]